MKTFMSSKNLFIEISAGLLILLYGYTALSKAMRFGVFRRALAESPLIQHGAVFIGWLVIIAELMIVLLLFFPATRRTGFFFSFGLLGLFTLYLIYMVSASEKLPCGCGGVINKLSWKEHIIFNLFLLLTNGIALWMGKRQMGHRSQISQQPGEEKMPPASA